MKSGGTAVVPDEVIALATKRFIAGQRVEVGEIAAEAGLNRSTVYRRYRGRNGLLAEVIWLLTIRGIEISERDAHGVGAERVANFLAAFAAKTNRADYFRGFLTREPERAMRLMTTWSGGVQPRIVARVRELLEAEVQAGTLVPPLPLDDLALILVRITETFVYARIISGDEPDAEKVRQACGALLGIRPPTNRPPTNRTPSGDSDATGELVRWHA